MAKKKYKESDTVHIRRSSINFAPYNPKNHSKAQIESQKNNIKKVAFLGGIVWNKITGNLIDGHKRIMALDILNGYDGTSETDYDVKVEMIELDEKTEKEQNIYQTANKTDFDEELLRLLVPGIDYEAAGLTDYDLEFLGIDLNAETADEVLRDLEDFYQPVQDQKDLEKAVKKELSAEEKKENVKSVKEDIQQKAIEKVQNMDAYVTLSFDSWKNKEAFMLRFDMDPELKMIKGERLSSMVERIE